MTDPRSYACAMENACAQRVRYIAQTKVNPSRRAMREYRLLNTMEALNEWRQSIRNVFGAEVSDDWFLARQAPFAHIILGTVWLLVLSARAQRAVRAGGRHLSRRRTTIVFHQSHPKWISLQANISTGWRTYHLHVIERADDKWVN